MVTVACVWWGWYPREYVERLQAGVERWLSSEHRFVCMTDRDVDCESIPLDCDLAGNLPLTALYRPDNGLEGRVLALDLDSLIVGPLDDLAAFDGDFAITRDFNTGRIGGFMRAFEAGSHPHLWEAAQTSKHRMEIPFLTDHLRRYTFWQDIAPGQVVSYKRDCRGGLPHDARIVSFHGKPKMHELNGWVADRWMR